MDKSGARSRRDKSHTREKRGKEERVVKAHEIQNDRYDVIKILVRIAGARVRRRAADYTPSSLLLLLLPYTRITDIKTSPVRATGDT